MCYTGWFAPIYRSCAKKKSFHGKFLQIWCRYKIAISSYSCSPMCKPSALGQVRFMVDLLLNFPIDYNGKPKIHNKSKKSAELCDSALKGSEG